MYGLSQGTFLSPEPKDQENPGNEVDLCQVFTTFRVNAIRNNHSGTLNPPLDLIQTRCRL